MITINVDEFIPNSEEVEKEMNPKIFKLEFYLDDELVETYTSIWPTAVTDKFLSLVSGHLKQKNPHKILIKLFNPNNEIIGLFQRE